MFQFRKSAPQVIAKVQVLLPSLMGCEVPVRAGQSNARRPSVGTVMLVVVVVGAETLVLLAVMVTVDVVVAGVLDGEVSEK
jgi:hypothetical protein